MRILDLFCGAGGASMGYHRAWPEADIVGVDISPQPDYPFTFVQGDALNPPVRLDGFDFIHASPPCQAYSVSTPDKSLHPNLLGPTRALLEGRRYVIENVVGSPIAAQIMLCGSMFGLQVQRHRYFEFWPDAPLLLTQACNHKAWPNPENRPYQVAGNPQGNMPWHARRGNLTHRFKYRDTEHGRELMGLPWVTDNRGITEAIPPAYTEWIGEQLREQL